MRSFHLELRFFSVQFHSTAHRTHESVDEDFCLANSEIDSSWCGDSVLKPVISLSHLMQNKTRQNEMKRNDLAE